MHTDFFLGANSGKGFFSLYDGFCRDNGDYLYLIKAGPGGGKSGFMRRIGEEAEALGKKVEYILCSGDPDSLDGVYIPEMKLGFADATAPHSLEPRVFGLDSNYVNLGIFCGRVHSTVISECQSSYRSYYTKAYAYLRAAAELKKTIDLHSIDERIINKCQNRAVSAVKAELGRKAHERECKLRQRFISAISCKGQIVLDRTVSELCKQIYIIDDRFGLADTYLKAVVKEAAGRCGEMIVCPSPLLPEKLEAVIFPGESLGFVSSPVMKPDAPCRHVRLDALITDRDLRALRESERLIGDLISKGITELSRAKERHDWLEAFYRPYVDFDALSRFTDETLTRIFG